MGGVKREPVWRDMRMESERKSDRGQESQKRERNNPERKEEAR